MYLQVRNKLEGKRKVRDLLLGHRINVPLGFSGKPGPEIQFSHRKFYIIVNNQPFVNY